MNKYYIKFNCKKDFDKAREMNHLSDSIQVDEMVMIYTQEYHHERFAGFILLAGFDVEVY